MNHIKLFENFNDDDSIDIQIDVQGGNYPDIICGTDVHDKGTTIEDSSDYERSGFSVKTVKKLIKKVKSEPDFKMDKTGTTWIMISGSRKENRFDVGLMLVNMDHSGDFEWEKEYKISDFE